MSTLQRILYVEDEPDIQTIAKLVLEIAGFTVKACSSGEEAIQEAEAFAPDFILLDVMMPGIDGPATLKLLREISSLSETPVAFMTAKIQPSEIAHYKSLGARDVIHKPFDPMKLAEQVNAIYENQGCPAIS